MDEEIKNKVREIQHKYCGESVETKLYYAIEETKMKLEVKKDRLEINKIIENCLPLMKLNKTMTQECTDAILVYFIEKTEDLKDS